MSKLISIADLREAARRRLPRVLFAYIDGGAGDDRGAIRNVAAFDAYRLRPRYLVDVAKRNLETTLWDRRYASPFGIAPVGLAGLFHPRAEVLLAQAARAANLPYILSGASIGRIEDVARAAPDHAWYQLYAARDQAISDDMLRRAWESGLRTLVLTVDLPVPAKREREIRSGFDYAIGLTPSLLLDGLLHPRWTWAYLAQGGLPAFGDWAPYAAPGASSRAVGEFFVAQSYATLTWKDVERFRQQWRGRLVIKGVLTGEDARRAVACGADGVIVSNHGGRQLECLPVAIDALPEIRAAVGDDFVVMVDGGVRRGSDIAVALSLGADFVFAGRAPIYGVAALGRAGAARALDILREELDLAMGQIGVTQVAELGSEQVQRVS